MPDEVNAEHSDVATQPPELLEEKTLRVGARLLQTLEGDAHAPGGFARQPGTRRGPAPSPQCGAVLIDGSGPPTGYSAQIAAFP
jgi:hypothetical protein